MKPCVAFNCRRVRDELLRRADLALAGHGIGVAEEEIARELHGVAELAAQKRVHGHAELLAHDVEAGELDRRVELRAIVVKARRRIADLEPQRFEGEHIVPVEVAQEARERARRVLAATTHLAQPDVTVGGLDLDDRAHEAAPMRAVAVQKRRLERNGDGSGANRGDRGGHGEESEVSDPVKADGDDPRDALRYSIGASRRHPNSRAKSTDTRACTAPCWSKNRCDPEVANTPSCQMFGWM